MDESCKKVDKKESRAHLKEEKVIKKIWKGLYIKMIADRLQRE